MIFGERIRLRAIEREDLPLFVRWLNDPEIRQYLDLYIPLSHPHEEKWYENILKQPLEEQPLVIDVHTENNWKPVGNTSFMNVSSRDRCAEIGIFIGDKQYQNQGYGTEAMKLMVGHGFRNLNLHRIFLRVYATNPRAIRSYEKAGFVHEGIMRQARYLDGQYIDVLIMGILKSEWKEKQRT